MSEKTKKVTLPDGSVIENGSPCYALLEGTNPSKYVGGRRWNKVTLQLNQVTGDIFIKTKDGIFFPVSRYDLKAAP